MDGSYDAIVVGLGAMGSAAAHQLARRGLRVLGIEMFRPGHDRGSSHGHHRLIRRSSFGAGGYLPLAERALALWRELEEASGQALLRITGEVWLLHEAGNPEFRPGIEDSIARGFRVVLGEQEFAERFPGCRLHDGMVALYEADAGYVLSEQAIIAHVELARRPGAAIRSDEEATGWAAAGQGVAVDGGLRPE